MGFDFSGWATKNDLLCADGRIIRKDAFRMQNGETVPLVWMHKHDDPNNVLGQAVLRNMPDGVYAYCTFNENENAAAARELVEHGDVSQLSIFANGLKHSGNNVLHGIIREVSLVISGANPGAKIENVVLAHSDDFVDDEAVICTGEPIYLCHSNEYMEDYEDMPYERSVEEIMDTMTPEQLGLLEAMGDAAYNDGLYDGYDEGLDDGYDEGLDDGYDEGLDDGYDEGLDNGYDEGDYDDNGYDEGDYDDYGDDDMKHNAFDDYYGGYDDVLMHDLLSATLEDAKSYGSLRDSFMAHGADYGIDNIDYLFPDARNLDNPPHLISRNMDWVKNVMGNLHHIPFTRIKSTFADITEDDARAKGYIKGNLKKEEVFSLLKRTTGPTTVYKKQKMDRDDIVDITDFDVIAWLKAEMRMMLDEEIARAILVGDGRLASDDDHIKQDCIRPIINDADLFVIRWSVGTGSNDDEKAKNFARVAIKSRKNYKGSGKPTLFTTEDMLTDLLLLEDGIGHKLYKTEAELATALRVSNIVTVPVMEGVKDKDGKPVLGIIINLSDYYVGADKGGSINLFEDFDIDYNQEKYLIETRCSGALVKPFSAIVLRAGTENKSDEPGLPAAKAPYQKKEQ